MAANLRFAVLLVALCVPQTYGQLDISVCTGFDPTPSDPKFPSIPSSFEVHVEANIQDRRYTSDFHLWYDYNKGIVSMLSESAGVRTNVIYNFNTSQYITSDMDTNFCTVNRLDAYVPMFDIFGKFRNGVAQMLNPNEMLRFNDHHNNQTSIRGILCDWWTSCYYFEWTRTTMIVDWYYSGTAANWTTSTANDGVPVRASVAGKVHSQPAKPRAFNHMYEFFNFHIRSTPGDLSPFMTPDCAGEKSVKPLTNPTSAFHFTAEIADTTASRPTTTHRPHATHTTQIKTTLEPTETDMITFQFQPVTFHLLVKIQPDKMTYNCYIATLSDSEHAQVHTNSGMRAVELKVLAALGRATEVTDVSTLDKQDVAYCGHHGTLQKHFFTITV